MGKPFSIAEGSGGECRRPPLEIHVPISPTGNFLTRIHYLAASLQRCGGALREARLVVTVGADQEPEDLGRALPWSRQYPIQWRWLCREQFRAHSYYATALQRFRYDFQAGAVLMLDADTLIASDCSELLQRVQSDPAFYGFPEYVTPFSPLRHVRSDDEWWQAVYDAAGLGRVEYVYRHSFWNLGGHPTSERCPPYFNFGVLLAPREIMAAIGGVILDEMAHVERVVDFPFKCQVALTLALLRLGLPHRALAMRYNFPNVQVFAEAFRPELAEVRILHYLRKTAYFDKDRDLESRERLASWLFRRGPGLEVNEKLRDAFLRAHALAARDEEGAPAAGGAIRIAASCAGDAGHAARVLAAYRGDPAAGVECIGTGRQDLTSPDGPPVVCLRRNLGDAVVVLDDQIRRNTFCLVEDRETYLALPAQLRYRYLIRYALPRLIAFHLAWRRPAPGLRVVHAPLEDLAAGSAHFFTRIIECLDGTAAGEKLRSSLQQSEEGIGEDPSGRSVELLSAGNKALLEDLLLDYPEDLSPLWLELPWRRAHIGAPRYAPNPRSILAEVAACPYNRNAGEVLSVDPHLRLEVKAENWFFLLPRHVLAPGGRESAIKLVVRGEVGSVFSLYWRRPGESFAETRSTHRSYCSGAAASAVTFSLQAIPPEVTFFRLDCFNDLRRPGIGEILEIVRLEG